MYTFNGPFGVRQSLLNEVKDYARAEAKTSALQRNDARAEAKTSALQRNESL